MARDTNFYYSFLVLPAEKRRAIVAVWDFCRAVDDAVDEVDEQSVAACEIERWRSELAAEVERAGNGVRLDGVKALLRAQAERAREYYRKAAAALPKRDARRLVAAEIMGAVYRAILTRIERRDYDVFTETVRVPRPRRALIAAATWARTAVGL